MFLQNFAVRLLVVIAYAQGRIGLQGPTFQARTVAVQNMARGPGSLHLGQQIPVSCQDARHVHDFAKGTDAILCPQVRQGPGVQHGARVLEGRAGHAGRQGNVDAHRQIPACVQHVAYACHAADIGYLVGIRHHFRGTAGEHGPGKVLRGEHGGLYVQMGIHETGHQGPIFAVHLFAGLGRGTVGKRQDSQDVSVANEHRPVLQNLPTEDINHTHAQGPDRRGSPQDTWLFAGAMPHCSRSRCVPP